MAEATDLQMQDWSGRVRLRCEQLRALRVRLVDDNGSVESVFERVNGSGGWIDQHTTAPNTLTGEHLMQINALSQNLGLLLDGGPFADDAAKLACVNTIIGNLAVVERACVRPIQEAI